MMQMTDLAKATHLIRKKMQQFYLLFNAYLISPLDLFSVNKPVLCIRGRDNL